MPPASPLPPQTLLWTCLSLTVGITVTRNVTALPPFRIEVVQVQRCGAALHNPFGAQVCVTVVAGWDAS